MAAIEVEDLFKSYGPVDAVRGISFRVEEGEVFALLGPNGAGKTTTLEILEGHRRCNGGRVLVLGVDPHLGGRDLRARIGIVLQSTGLDAELTVREVLALYAASYPRSLPVADVIGLVGLEDKRRARVKTLSGGQRRRLDLALALVGDPDLVFLDEPTTGLTRPARRAWRLVEDLRGLGRTIVHGRAARTAGRLRGGHTNGAQVTRARARDQPARRSSSRCAPHCTDGAVTRSSECPAPESEASRARSHHPPPAPPAPTTDEESP